eukprot:scaffold1276_cov162-Amphora_coffeaeformis.AAC.3
MDKEKQDGDDSMQPLPTPQKQMTVARDQLRDSRYLVNCRQQQQQQQQQAHNTNHTPVLVPMDKSPAVTAFYVSIHPRAYDPVRWFLYDKHRYYEYYTEHAWKDILEQQRRRRRRKATTAPHIVDVGGNIGYYALYSAALMGKAAVEVDVIEANVVNLVRACESLELNGWNDPAVPGAPQIRLWNVGVSNSTTMGETGIAWLLIPSNPGGARIVSKSEAQQAYEDGKAVSITPVDTTSLDDFARARGWLSNNDNSSSPVVPRIEILKIDVERHEAQVLLGARKLLQRHIVQHIFIEVARRTADPALQGRALQSLVEAGYTWCGWGGFQGAQLGNVPTETSQWHTHDWSNHFYEFWATQPGSALNLWFQLDPTCGRNLVWTFQYFTTT